MSFLWDLEWDFLIDPKPLLLLGFHMVWNSESVYHDNPPNAMAQAKKSLLWTHTNSRLAHANSVTEWLTLDPQ